MPESSLSRPVIGVGVLIWRNQELLLGKRLLKEKINNQGFCWQFPGGHLESGESVTECAAREVMEETGLTIKALRHLGYTDKSFAIGPSQYLTLLVSGEYESGEAQTLEPDKCEVWQWFDYRQLPSPLFKPITLFMLQQDDLYKLHCVSRVLQDTPLIVHK